MTYSIAIFWHTNNTILRYTPFKVQDAIMWPTWRLKVACAVELRLSG